MPEQDIFAEVAWWPEDSDPTDRRNGLLELFWQFGVGRARR